MLTVPLTVTPVQATAISGLESPFRSTATNASGSPQLEVELGLRLISVCGRKPPPPVPSRMLAVPSLFEVARSGFPSPLKSATTTPQGLPPVVKVPPGAKEPKPVEKKTVTELEL